MSADHDADGAGLVAGSGATSAIRGRVRCIIAPNDYLQLTTVRSSLRTGQFEGLDPFVWTNPHRVFGALDGLGAAVDAE